ncbi:MAG: hypothetical protein Q7T80_01810 [Methanoregula sp.]|nr:hypothetical protein [Methanoregula sp.]
MKQMKICVVLLALLLAAIVMVPIVSATDDFRSLSNDKDLIESNYIPIDTAREQAAITMVSMIKSGALDENWVGASVNKEPVIIYDINGKMLFYQFFVEKDGKKTGQILSPASKVLGTMVKQIGDPATLDFYDVQKKAEQIVTTKYSGFTIQSTKIVAYSYPKMGVMILLSNLKSQEQKSIIIDAVDFSEIPEKMPLADGEPGAWSYYGQIPEKIRLENIVHWDTQNKAGESDERIMGTKALGEANYIQYFPTTDQEQTEWCAIATAWLITKFHYPTTSRTQTNVANNMNVYSNTGPAWDEEIQYYLDSYASGGLGKSNSYTDYWSGSPQDVTYDMIKTEINANRPLKISHSGHARTCIGYWQYTSGEKLYKFSDTWPSSPKTYWENPPNPYSSITGYMSYIITQ